MPAVESRVRCPRGDLSDSLDLAWSAGSRILYQQTGNRNYYELDPETKEERLLATTARCGWMFSPVYSPDGQEDCRAMESPPDPGHVGHRHHEPPGDAGVQDLCGFRIANGMVR